MLALLPSLVLVAASPRAPFVPLTPSEACLRAVPLGREEQGEIARPKGQNGIADQHLVAFDLASEEQAELGFSGVMKRRNRMLTVLHLAEQVKHITKGSAPNRDATSSHPQAAPLPQGGDIVEAGVAGGYTAFSVFFYLLCLGDVNHRFVRLFDTWNGLPPQEKTTKGGASIEEVDLRLQKDEDKAGEQGEIPGTTPPQRTSRQASLKKNKLADHTFQPGDFNVTLQDFTNNARAMGDLFRMRVQNETHGVWSKFPFLRDKAHRQMFDFIREEQRRVVVQEVGQRHQERRADGKAVGEPSRSSTFEPKAEVSTLDHIFSSVSWTNKDSSEDHEQDDIRVKSISTKATKDYLAHIEDRCFWELHLQNHFRLYQGTFADTMEKALLGSAEAEGQRGQDERIEVQDFERAVVLNGPSLGGLLTRESQSGSMEQEEGGKGKGRKGGSTSTVFSTLSALTRRTVNCPLSLSIRASGRTKPSPSVVSTTSSTPPTARPSVSLLMCDGDLYSSTQDCLKAGTPALLPRAWIYYDDMWVFPPVFRAVRDFFEDLEARQRKLEVEAENIEADSQSSLKHLKFGPVYVVREISEDFSLLPASIIRGQGLAPGGWYRIYGKWYKLSAAAQQRLPEG
ncbi:unnamed protein product [Amoebophrya sp. A25]|nr:unnamed protein product [Amoebophrya sp. A25]|eukprot:GSA25T00004786001.1